MIDKLKHEVERILLHSRAILQQCDAESETGRSALRIERAAMKLLGRQPGCVCPECGYRFRGNGWDGIDAHWRARHESLMPYEQAWPLIRTGSYRARFNTQSPGLFDDG